ncbi:MAG TPA: glycosyltransferase family 87 protein [Burkholderiales bacterium]|nr:glycosyltransferase family 87 protein [Burkholderiales bacterium]
MTASHSSFAAASSRRSIVWWAIVGLAVVLYYFRFRIGAAGPEAMTSVYLMSADASAGACLMKGERLVTCAIGFPYPPLFALLTVPFAFLPLWAKNLAWYGVLVGTTYGCFRICETLTIRAFGVARDELAWLRVFSILLTLKFVLSVFENHAYDVVVFFFILVGLYGLWENKTFPAVSGLAVAVALKATPLLMLLYPLFLRKWTVFALAAGLCVLLSLLPDLLFTAHYPGHGFLWTWIEDVAVGGLLGTSPEIYGPLIRDVNVLNQSLKGFVFAIVHERLGADVAAHSRMILYSVYLAYGLAVLAVLLLSAKVEGALLWGASVILISMVLLSPVSSKSHFVVLLLPHMAIVAYLIKHREAWRAVVPLLCASFALNTLTSRFFMGRELSNQMLSSGCITLGTLLLLAVVAVIVLHSRKVARPLPGEMPRSG